MRSRQAGKEALRRMYARQQDRDAMTDWATREAQYEAARDARAMTAAVLADPPA